MKWQANGAAQGNTSPANYPGGKAEKLVVAVGRPIWIKILASAFPDETDEIDG